MGALIDWQENQEASKPENKGQIVNVKLDKLQVFNYRDHGIFTLYASVSDGDDSETWLAIDDNIGCKSIDA